MRVVIDHVRGSRRGQRQEFSGLARVRFGRHPDNEVTFDAHRDLDASSRHAELRKGEKGYVLCDVGSSNGTRVGGNAVAELLLSRGCAIEVEFGTTGPVVQIWVGEDGDTPPTPPAPESSGLPEVVRAAAQSARRSGVFAAVGFGLLVAVLLGMMHFCK